MNVTAAVTKLVKSTLLAAPLALVPAFASVMMQAITQDGFQSGLVYAADKDAEAEKPKYKTRKTPALREKVFKKLAVVQELTSPEEIEGKPTPKANFPEALKELKDIQKETAKWNRYELAQLYNYFGFVYYSLENYKEAIRYYKLVVAQSPDIPQGLEVGTLYTIAQLYFVVEDYRNAIVHLKKWMEVSTIVGADAYVLLGQAYYSIEDMKQALANVNIAVDMYEAKGKVPKENWYSLQRALYYDKGDNKTVIKILEKMVRHYPKATYFKQLSGMYGAAERDKDQLHMLDGVRLMGALNKEKEILNLAYLYLGEDYPYKAAVVVEKGLKDKTIEDTSKNLELLATAWRMSSEVKKSIPVMEKAAAKSDKGDLYARLAGTYLDNDDYKKALSTATKAHKRGGIKRVDQLYVVQGMASANMKRYDECVKMFKKALKDKRSRKFSQQWIQYCEGEIKRTKQLAQ
jgi:tetratricopeptide (TPR) repeat protein